jgi:hypothetical protein
METELRERRSDFAGLPVRELNPNPLADSLGKLKETRGFLLNQGDNALSWQPSIHSAANEVNRQQRWTLWSRLRSG